LPTGLIALAAAILGLALGVGVTLALLRRRLPHVARAAATASSAQAPAAAATGVEAEAPPEVTPATGLIERALRRPLARLRRIESLPTEVLDELERVAWQARMLRAAPRPLQARPHSPSALLESAAEQVELLRLGKVGASWTLRNRQPVHVDAARARSAFRELLTACAEEAGEGGRIALRVLPGRDARHPVALEFEVGRRGAQPDALAVLVARRLLEGQGALVETEGAVVRVHLRSVVAEPARPPEGQSASNS
jgi:hypothetical protein